MEDQGHDLNSAKSAARESPRFIFKNRLVICTHSIAPDDPKENPEPTSAVVKKDENPSTLPFCLLLLRSRLLFLCLGPLGPLTSVPGIGTGNTKLAEGVSVLLASLDLALRDTWGSGDDGEGGVGPDDLLGGLEVLSCGVALLGSLGLAREEDELASVLAEAGNVGLESLDGLVAASVVNRDADAEGEVLGDLGFLELCERETTASTNTAVVLDGWATDDGPQKVDRSWCDLSSLCETGISAAELASWLVEVSPNITLPILAEMVVRELLVVLDSHLI